VIVTSKEKAAVLIERLIRLCDLGSAVTKLYKFIFLNGPVFLSDLENKSGFARATIFRALNQLKKAGLIVEDKRNRWFAII